MPRRKNPSSDQHWDESHCDWQCLNVRSRLSYVVFVAMSSEIRRLWIPLERMSGLGWAFFPLITWVHPDASVISNLFLDVSFCWASLDIKHKVCRIEALVNVT